MKEPNGNTGAVDASHHRGDNLPKADSERAATCVAIPDWIWMEKHAPGAIDAVLMISREDLSEPQRQRLARLTGEGTRYAWREPARNAKANGKNLSEAELQTAHFELMWDAFRAADFTPTGGREIEKERLVEIGEDAQKLAKKIREVGNGAQLRDLWHLYRHEHHDDELLANLPHCLSIATALDGLADLFRSAAPLYKPEGPVPPVGQPNEPEALKTTVIRKIAETCERLFGATLYGTVARLANASLDRKDITAISVRGSLRGVCTKFQ